MKKHAVKDEEIKEEKVEEVLEEVIEDVELSELEKKDIEIQELKEQIQKLKNDLLKEHADLENTKKRLEKERITERKYSGLELCKKLLTPLDHFELALKHDVSDELVDSFVKGFSMIKDQLMKTLEDEGVSEVDPLDEEYDPNYHQAIMTEKVDKKAPGIVTDVLQKGYLYKDRLIRPAMVKISE